jgi:transcriptional regulator with XRE-family HTH domain
MVNLRVKMPTFGARLRAAMLAAGISENHELARRLKVTPQVVRKWLREEKPSLSAENIVSLSEVLNVRVIWLARGTGQVHNFTVSKYSEAELIDAFRTLGTKEKIMLRDFIGLLMRYQDG